MSVGQTAELNKISAWLHETQSQLAASQAELSQVILERDRLKEALRELEPALELAYTIVNAVPSHAHVHAESGSSMQRLGQLVNTQEDGSHGYRIIADARDALRAALQTLGSAA